MGINQHEREAWAREREAWARKRALLDGKLALVVERGATAAAALQHKLDIERGIITVRSAIGKCSTPR